MALQLRAVIVKQLPETENDEQGWAFLEELKMSLPAERPRIVLNCGRVPSFGRSSLHLLLCCLEEAMKRNGDVKLSAMPKAARTMLESSGVDRLFQIFEDDAAAVKSFQRLPILTIPQSSTSALPVASEAYDIAALSADSAENAA